MSHFGCMKLIHNLGRTCKHRHVCIFILINAVCILSIMHCSYLIVAVSKMRSTSPILYILQAKDNRRSYFYFSLLGRHIWFTSAPSHRILLCQSHFSTRRSDSAGLRLNFRRLLHIPRVQCNLRCHAASH